VPLVKWLRKELKYLIQENLDEEIVKKYGIIEPIEVKNLITKFENDADYLYNRIWLLIILHKWLRKFAP
jgi:asparagine synthase (glutamine-hydrolysing)